MQMLNRKNKQMNKKIKKSHICLFGSLLIIIGISILSMNHVQEIKKKLFSDMKLRLDNNISDEIIEDIPEVEEKKEEPAQPDTKIEEKKVNYSKYLGILEIPKIGLKRGFYGFDSKYNNIEYNVTMVGGSTMPDVINGNLILMAHSGDAYISYFAYLYRLNIGDMAYITYGGVKYKYQIVNIYNIPKTGKATITRNMDKTCLTLITCTKDSDTEQTIYILERV